MKKVQSQLLVAPVTRYRADALALVMEVSRAEVWRMALENAGLPGLEKQYAAELATLDPLAERFGMTRLELAGQMADDGLTVEEIRDRRKYARAA